MGFHRATKFTSKLRMAIAGPSGSGKTFTALTLAHALADGQGVAVIDTERGSASKYADLFPAFDVSELDTYHPNNYINAIREAEQAGYAVLVIDSLSHAWNGPGGLLEIVEGIAKRNQSKSSFNAWGEATPLQNRLIDAITRSKLHIICTMRTKTEYVVEQNERGKSAPRKVGTAPVQRADVEYEFDVYADMDIDNTLIVQKSRCPALSGQIIPKPGAQVAESLKVWLQGAPPPLEAHEASNNHAALPADPQSMESQIAITEQQLASIRKLSQHIGKPEPDNVTQISYLAARKLIAQLTSEYKSTSKTPKNGTHQAEASVEEVSLHMLIGKAKRRAMELRIASTDEEWRKMLDKLGIKEITSEKDIKAINDYLDPKNQQGA